MVSTVQRCSYPQRCDWCVEVFACPRVPGHGCLHVRVLVAERVGLVARQDFCKKEVVETQAKIKSSRIDSSKYQIAPGLFFKSFFKTYRNIKYHSILVSSNTNGCSTFKSHLMIWYCLNKNSWHVWHLDVLSLIQHSDFDPLLDDHLVTFATENDTFSSLAIGCNLCKDLGWCVSREK